MNGITRSVAAAAMFIVVGGLVHTNGTGAGEKLHWQEATEKKIPASSALVKRGEQVYMEACFYCHGEQGRGEGKGGDYLTARPRDFTAGKFKVRTTSSGEPPLDEDLFRTISVGFPASGMPRFRHLTPEERWALVYYLKTLTPRLEGEEPEPITIGEAPPRTDALLLRGRQLFDDAECWKCHGKQGKGDGPSAADLRDDWDQPIRLLDWTEGERVFKRGARARDVMYTFMTGFAGTPMPSYEGALTEEEAWALAYYVEQIAKSADEVGQKE